MLLFILACAPTKPAPLDTAGPDSASDSAPDSDPDSAPAPSESDAVYNPELLHEVVITMADEDWAALRAQTRSIYDMLEGDCLSAPWESPYTEFPATVSFDGEDLGTVGLRKKGLLGSASTERPSLRIDTDEYVDDARYRGLEKLVLNNNNQDPTRLRTCLAHGFFADAGLVAPRCSLAHVTVNGEDLGVYDNTESIDEDLIARVLDAPPTTLYEGRLSDFREGWLESFEAKSDESTGVDLQAVADALAEDDDHVLAALEPVLDLEAFYRFWAAEAIAGHWDGYSGNTNNFYVYGAPEDGRIRFIAAGPDAAFDSREPFGAGEPVWVATAGALSNRLIQIPEARDAYEATVQTLLDEAWDEDARLARIDAWTEQLDGVMERGQKREISDLRAIVAAKAEDVEDELGGRVEPADLRGSPCFVSAGQVSVDFTTSFGTYPDGDLYTVGEADTFYEIGDTVYTSLQDGVSAGDYGDGRVLLLTISEIAEGTYLAPYVLFDADLLLDGAEIPIDGYSAEAALLYSSADTGGQWTTAAYLGEGALTLEVASDEDGALVRGSMDLSVLTSGG